MENKKEEFTVWESAVKGRLLHTGKVINPPVGWIFVPSGDPGLTRRIKSSGEYWVMVHRRKNRTESLGVWACETLVTLIKSELETERATPAYQRKLDSAKRSRNVKQGEYETEFRNAVIFFLNFHHQYAELAEKLATAITVHAIPVGSGTVARTQMIPLEQRAEAATIAWLRHKTTAYDNMSIPKIKGERRNVRRELAERSRELLKKYRKGEIFNSSLCPLTKALNVN